MVVVILWQTQYDLLAILYLTLIFHQLTGCYYYFDDTDEVMNCQRSQDLAPGHII